MKKATLSEAIAEALRFVKRAQELQQFQAKLEKDIKQGVLDGYPKEDLYRAEGLHFNLWFPGMSKHTAAVRRSSLDLTHTLAQLRRDE